MLILFGFAIFVSVVLVLRWVGAVRFETLIKPKPRARWVFSIYLILTGVLFLSSIYYGVIGFRPFVWFCVFALVGLLSLHFGASSIAKQRNFSIFTVMFLIVLESSLPIVQNRGVLFGSDQWRDLRVTEFIIDKGTFDNFPGLETGFYSFIPLFNVLNAAFSEIVGFPTMIAFAVLQTVLCLISTLSVYAITMKITNDVPVSLLAVMFLVATPRLAIVAALPSTTSISLGFLLILLFLKGNTKGQVTRNIVVITAVLAFAIAAFHPVGVFPILGICLGVISISYFFTRERLPARAISFTNTVFIICLIIPLAYWTLDSQVLAAVVNPSIRFLRILTRFEYFPSIYVPQYESSGFVLFSFAWALPVALSATYVATVLIGFLKGKHRLSRDLRQHFVAVSALAGVLLILGAFWSVLLNPGAAVERYINTMGYILLVVPSSFVLGWLLSSRKKIAVLLAVMLFSTGLFFGSMSPDWAPFENPTFGALRFTFTSSIEADTMATLLPNNTRLYEDHDMFLSAVARQRNILFITDRSYQTTRKVVQDFKSNSFDSFDPNYKDVIIVIKIDEIVDQNLFNRYINVMYNSERHVMVSIP